MVVKIYQSLNLPEDKRMIKIKSKPDRYGQLVLVQSAPPWIIEVMQGRPSTYFNASILPGGNIKIHCETKSPEEWK